MKILDKILPLDDKKRKWAAIGITVLASEILTLIGIFGIGSYGIGIFILIPFFIGFSTSILLGYKKELTRKYAITTGITTLGIFAASLLVFAIEGMICIAMAAPFAIVITWIGSLIGYKLINNSHDKAPTTLYILFLIIPLTSFIEKDSKATLTAVVTSIEINSDAKTIWKNVIEFPELKEPEELLFKAGIAYPINAKIEGTGVGAIRHCNFTTGSFVEPITVWDEEKLLKFDVVEQPEPMKELSFWDIDAPHLHDYFVSKQGQFKLTKLENGNILLEGTTYYYHNIKPEFYWQLWSNYIIHKIHNRVLTHIKLNSEKKKVKDL